MIALGLNNLINDAVLTSNINFNPLLPLENIMSPCLPLVARSLVDSPFALNIAFKSAQKVGVVMLLNHNFGWNAKLRVKWFLQGEEIGVSGDLLVWPAHDGAVISTAEKSSLRSDFTFFLPANCFVDALMIEVFQPAVGNFVQVGRIFVGESFVPVLGVEYGNVSLGLVSRSSLQVSSSGFRFGSMLKPLRNAQITFSALSEMEAFDTLFTAQRRADLFGEVIFAGCVPPWTLIPGMGAKAVSLQHHAQCFIGNFNEFNPLQQAFFNGFGTAVVIAEVAV